MSERGRRHVASLREQVGGSYRHGRDNRSKKREVENLQSGVPGVTCRSPEQCIAERYTRYAACLRVTLLVSLFSRASIHARNSSSVSQDTNDVSVNHILNRGEVNDARRNVFGTISQVSGFLQATCVCAKMYVCMHMRICVCICVCVCVYIRMCVCVYMRVPISFSLLLFWCARSHVGLVLESGKQRNVVGRGTRLGIEKILELTARSIARSDSIEQGE